MKNIKLLKFGFIIMFVMLSSWTWSPVRIDRKGNDINKANILYAMFNILGEERVEFLFNVQHHLYNSLNEVSFCLFTDTLGQISLEGDTFPRFYDTNLKDSILSMEEKNKVIHYLIDNKIIIWNDIGHQFLKNPQKQVEFAMAELIRSKGYYFGAFMKPFRWTWLNDDDYKNYMLNHNLVESDFSYFEYFKQILKEKYPDTYILGPDLTPVLLKRPGID